MYEIIVGRNQKDRDEFGTDGTILLGKHYVKMGQTTSLSNPVLMDVIRSHVVFVTGKRGGGKCLHGDTLITLSDGSEVPIRLLHEKNEKILALNHQLKIVNSNKEGFYKRTVDRLLHIKLRSGREIKLTPEHPLLTINGWTKAGNLQSGSRIATPRKIDFFGSENMPENEVKIAAYLIAEGHIGKNKFFTNYDESIVRDLEDSLKIMDNCIELVPLSKKGEYQITSRSKRKVLNYEINRNALGRFDKGTSIEHEKTKIRNFLEEHKIYKLLSKEKFVPAKILNLPKNKIALFLNRLFSCDGSIYKSGDWEISYGSSSEKMIKQVQSLLLRFEILSKIRTKNIKLDKRNFISYEIIINGQDVLRFINEIGFFGEKEKKQETCMREIRETQNNPNIDTVPKEIWASYRPKNWALAGLALGYKIPKTLRSSISYAPSRQKLLQIALSDNSERIRLIAESDIFWDEIVSVEILLGNFEVFDISVPELHNFIANNIIVHNSYSMGVIAEGMTSLPKEISQNLSIIMLDTMGIYWTMKYPNKKEENLLAQWNIKPKSLDVKIFTPKGFFQDYKQRGIPTDFPFAIKPSELDPSDWHITFGVSQNDPIGVLIERVIIKLREENKEYNVDDIISEIRADQKSLQNVKDAAENRFLNAKSWGLFDVEGTKFEELVKGGQVTVLDVSVYAMMSGASGVRALVIGLVAEKLFIKRMIARKNEEFRDVHEAVHYFEEEKSKKKEFPMIWLVVDEAHEFLPLEGKTVASDPLITILREGREPGISLVLASQQPGKIHTDVMTQSDIVVAHRITAKLDTDALGALMQSYMREGLDVALDNLPREAGAALIFDDTNERLYPMRVRPRFTWHGGEAPTAMHKERKLFEF